MNYKIGALGRLTRLLEVVLKTMNYCFEKLRYGSLRQLKQNNEGRSYTTVENEQVNNKLLKEDGGYVDKNKTKIH